MTAWRKTTRPSLSPWKTPKTPSWDSGPPRAWRSWTPEEVKVQFGFVCVRKDKLPLRSRLCSPSGRCHPDDLKVEEEEEEEDPVTDIEAELLWENQPHPPRGDVPNRRPYLDHGDQDLQDQAAPSSGQIHYRQLPGTGQTGSTGQRHGGLKVSVCCTD